MTNMVKTFASYAFGCRVNQAEKETLDRQLSVIGYQYSEKNPAIYIINSCAVTGKAEREARQFINQIRRKYPRTKIIVTGCSATKWINEGIKIQAANLLIDNLKKEYIAQLITTQTGPATRHPHQVLELPTTLRPCWGSPTRVTRFSEKLNYSDKYLNSKRLLLKIQDGCQRFCTYCIVPYLRGQPRSKSIKYLVSSIKEKEFEIKEVILAAINTQAYGYDTGESFVDLIRTILQQTKIARLSFGSIHPWSLDNKFLALYRKLTTDNRLIRYFHIPLQSGSNKILRLMKRDYTREEFSKKLYEIKRINPLAFIGTDIIVGFLDENDRDFEDTYNFIADSPIAKLHVFRFSKREKTAAFYMAKRLKEPQPAVKQKRAKILAELGKRKYQKFLEKHLGLAFPALFLERRIDAFQEALLDNQVPIFIETRKNLVGEIKNIKVEGLKEAKLFGKIQE